MNRIKEILERKGVSQTDLAHRLGKTFNMVNLYATNKVQPPIPILYKIAEILDVDIRELLVSNKINIFAENTDCVGFFRHIHARTLLKMQQ